MPQPTSQNKEKKLSLNIKSDENWLTSFVILTTSTLVAMTVYLSVAALKYSINPEDWGFYISATTIMTSLIILVVGLFIYFAREFQLDIDKLILNLIDTDEYEGKKYLDFLMSHYGNVCSIATLSAVATLGIRNAASILGVTTSSILVGLLIIAALTIYLIKLVKTITYMHSTKIILLSILPVMIITDAALISMLIRSIPK